MTKPSGRDFRHSPSPCEWRSVIPRASSTKNVRGVTTYRQRVFLPACGRCCGCSGDKSNKPGGDLWVVVWIAQGVSCLRPVFVPSFIHGGCGEKKFVTRTSHLVPRVPSHPPPTWASFTTCHRSSHPRSRFVEVSVDVERFLPIAMAKRWSF